MTSPQRYALMAGEMVPADNGQWVEWEDYAHARREAEQVQFDFDCDYREAMARYE